KAPLSVTTESSKVFEIRPIQDAWRRRLQNNSFAQGQPFRQSRRQTSRHDFGLRGRNVVVQTAQFDRAFVHVVNRIRRLRIAVARLANTADVDEILSARFDFEFGVSAAAHDAVADERVSHVRVTEKTNRRVLIRKTGGYAYPGKH